jgi:hypothetical protein
MTERHVPLSKRRLAAHQPADPGLGDLVAGALNAVGVRKHPGCGCHQKQAALNAATPSWVRRWLSALGLRPAGRQPNHHVQHDGKRQDRQAPLKSQDA